MISPSDTHFAQIGDALTACSRPATGKGGVFLRSDNPKRVTCEECRERAGIRGPVDKGSARTADAGRQLDRAIATYGSIGSHQGQVPRPNGRAKPRRGALKAEKSVDSKWFPDPSENNPEAVCRGDQRAHTWLSKAKRKWVWSATSQEPLGPRSFGMSRKQGEADSLATAKRNADAWLKEQDKANG